jgi:hypothetical protein
MAMRRAFMLSVLGFAVSGFLLSAQDATPIPSGPKEGKFLPAPFDAYTFNGPAEHKGRYHSLVTRYGLSPAVIVFAREEPDAKKKDQEAGLNALLTRLDEAVGEYKHREFHAAVVFLSPDAQSSITNPTEADPAKLVDEAKKRDELYARVEARAQNFKSLDVAVMPAAGPKQWDINPKADVTVVFFNKLQVVLSRGFRTGELTEAAVAKVMAKVKDTLSPAPKKTPPKA